MHIINSIFNRHLGVWQIAVSLCRLSEPAQDQKRKHLKSSSDRRGPLQHMHFNSLFDGVGPHEEEQVADSTDNQHCTSAQKLKRMPTALQQQHACHR